MLTDQVEILTHQMPQMHPSNPKDIDRILKSSAVFVPPERRGKGLLDSVAQEPESSEPEGEKPLVRTFLAEMEWAAPMLVVGAVLFLIIAVVNDSFGMPRF